MSKNQFSQLKREVQEIGERHPQLARDDAFMVWFIRGFLTDDEPTAIGSLTGGAGDKSADAIYIDDNTRVVCVVQGKYHSGAKAPATPRQNLIALAHSGRALLLEEDTSFKNLLAKCNAIASDKYRKARELIHRKSYRLNLYFVTTGNVSPESKSAAEDLITDWPEVSLDTHTRKSLVSLMQDYLEGAAPPIPTVALPYKENEIFNRFDKATGINSYAFSVSGSDLGQLFKDYGIRLFARNVRGYLGKTNINAAMAYTLQVEPRYFWHFNNGVTIVCDEAKTSDMGRERFVRITNPQIINGQQTTRVLAENTVDTAQVLVRVIGVPRQEGMYNKLVSEIVAAANSQNAISLSDLRANDEEQVRLEREFSKLRYGYIRKTTGKSEVKRRFGKSFVRLIDKSELAIAVASCTLDPSILRKGKQRLFTDEYYSDIFDGRPATLYLVMYWFHRIVTSRSKGETTRGYAKDLAANYCWSQFGNLLKSNAARQKFVGLCHKTPKRPQDATAVDFPKDIRPLIQFADTAFSYAAAFYNANKRRTGKLVDASGFFKNNSDLHLEFPQFVTSSRKQARLRMQQCRVKMSKILDGG